MEKIDFSCSASEVFVGVRAVGGSGGKTWVYKPDSAIKQIIVRHAGVIDSLVFISETGKQSPRFGGGGGDRTDKVVISNPAEFLTGISGTTGTFWGFKVIKSLQFHTNLSNIYGPFGTVGGSAFSLFVEDFSDCSLVGFHGRSGWFIDAIGYYARPPCSSFVPHPKALTVSFSDAISALSPRNPGPFGGAFGREWDDGVFTSITKILVHVNSDVNAIQCIRFEYVTTNKDGIVSLWSPRHGDSSHVLHKISIDYPDEYLMGISGYYSPVETNEGMETIRSINFMTNKGVYGPFGSEVGNYFCSPALPTGKIVGFFGRASSYLHAIGVHMDYVSKTGSV